MLRYAWRHDSTFLHSKEEAEDMQMKEKKRSSQQCMYTMDVTAVEEEKTTNSEANKKAVLPGEKSWNGEYQWTKLSKTTSKTDASRTAMSTPDEGRLPNH